MKINKINFIPKGFIICGFSLLFFSCAEEDGVPRSKIDYISANAWKTDKALLNNEANANVSEIYKNYKVNFRRNGTYSSTNTGFSANGNWIFSSDSTELILDKNTSNQKTWYIEVLNSKNFDFSFKENTDIYEIQMQPAI